MGPAAYQDPTSEYEAFAAEDNAQSAVGQVDGLPALVISPDTDCGQSNPAWVEFDLNGIDINVFSAGYSDDQLLDAADSMVQPTSSASPSPSAGNSDSAPLPLPTTDPPLRARHRVLADRDIERADTVTMRYVNRLSAFIIGTIVIVASIIGSLAIHETPEICSRLGSSRVKCPQQPDHLDLIRAAIIVGGFLVALLIYWASRSLVNRQR
jgi:hypothetical protein